MDVTPEMVARHRQWNLDSSRLSISMAVALTAGVLGCTSSGVGRLAGRQRRQIGGLISRALTATTSIRGDGARGSLAVDLCAIAAMEGLADEALRVASHLVGEDERSFALLGVATALSQGGDNRRAVDVAEEIPLLYVRSGALESIAIQASTRGELNRPMAVFVRALATTERLADKDPDRAYILGCLALAHALWGDPSQAKRLLAAMPRKQRPAAVLAILGGLAPALDLVAAQAADADDRSGDLSLERGLARLASQLLRARRQRAALEVIAHLREPMSIAMALQQLLSTHRRNYTNVF